MLKDFDRRVHTKGLFEADLWPTNLLNNTQFITFMFSYHCRSLLQQLQKLQTLVSGKVPRSCRMASTQTGTCLMVSNENELIKLTSMHTQRGNNQVFICV